MNLSIIIPCFNAEQTIRETIESINSQYTKELEIIVIDGGSTDKTLEIVNEYKNIIKTIISEPDNGQYSAVNKGIKLSSGDIVSYLNADDMYLPGTVDYVINHFAKYPSTNLLYGDCINLLPNGSTIAKPKFSFDFKIALYAALMINQPASFWRREIHNKIGYFDEKLDCCSDYDFYLKAGYEFDNKTIVHKKRFFAFFRIHPNQKSISHRPTFTKDTRYIRSKYFKRRHYLFRFFYKNFYLVKALIHMAKERKFIPIAKGISLE